MNQRSPEQSPSTPAQGSPPSPSVGALVCTHDARRLELVAAAVASVRAQTRPPEELLVVVDGDDHLTALVAARLPGERVEGLGRNQGVSVARTEGARRLGTDVVAFLDDDAEAEPTWLERLVEALQAPDVIGASGRSVPIWDAARPPWLPEEFLWTVGASYAGLPRRLARIRNIYGGCAALRRDVFLEVGGYDPGLGHRAGVSGGGEEAEFGLRAARRTGGTFAFHPGAVIHHHVPADRLTWRFYWDRCRSEGAQKVRLARLVQQEEAGTSSSRSQVSARGSALSDERAFALRMPAAAVRSLVTPGRRQRALGIVVGVLGVLVGMAGAALEGTTGGPSGAGRGAGRRAEATA
ncbi:glycosyltransferase family 2 protein [Nocardioides sp. GY 10127]|uniref:glycosyltransferase family 2 protein n=1 Tax=Nocardioides sp. GY 10127 TaxID=2569762 RepID=UPI00145850A8|nr:glycosyltransferase family 2 protein [Nocardioides sp. GY 10127]